MFSSKKDKGDPEREMHKAENETITSVIDKSMSISGELSFKGKTRIDGTVNGDITGEHLILSESGTITGDIDVSSFICQGSIEGNITAKLVTAKKGCSIHGKLEAGSLSVEPGAAIDGEVTTLSQPAPGAAARDTNNSSDAPKP